MRPEAASPLLRARRVVKSYSRGRFSGASREILAGVDLDLDAGATVGLVGASGSGKSTFARCLAGLEPPDAGEIRVDGVDVAAARGPALADCRRRVQLIFQDPAASFNPRFSAWDVVAEPLRIAGCAAPGERQAFAGALMAQVGLSPELGGRRALEFSGGQRQRLAIARALAADPRVLILDESLSGLDLSTQAQVVNLLAEIQREWNLACLVISHDLRLVAGLADELHLMHEGRIVESGTPRGLLEEPGTPLGRELASAVRALECALPDRLRC